MLLKGEVGLKPLDRDRRWLIFWMALALCAVGAAYANSFENGFHFDDFHTIVDNPAVRSLGNLKEFFTDANTFSVLPTNRTYRPIVSASLALDYALGHGYEPTLWFHVSTFAWFVVLLALLYLLYERVLERAGAGTASVWLALIGATWFGLHPAIAETVNYVIQRGDVYCTLGCVAALVLWTRMPKLRRTGLYLLPLALALLSKPPAAVFPVLLFFYVLLFEPEGNTTRGKKAALATLPSLAVTAALLWLQSAMTPKSFTPTILDASAYRLTQPYVWLRYCGELFLPIHLNVDTDLGVFSGMNIRALAGIALVVLLGIAIWLTARRRVLYPIAYGLIWFVVTQLPTSLYPLSEVENDHRMFFSFVGLILAVVWGSWLLLHRLLDEAIWKRLRPALVACVLLALGAYAWGVHVRNLVWRSESTLWKDDVQKSPHNGRGLMIYGLTLMSQGDYPKALDYYERALLYTPNYATLEINLGVVNGAMANTAEAERHFLRAVELTPGSDEPHTFYGRWLCQQGRTSEAIAQLRTAILLNPLRPMQREELIRAYQRSGDADSARKAAQETLEYVPGDTVALLATQTPATPQSPEARAVNDAATLINRSLALNQAGKFEDSIAVARDALKIDAKNALAWNNIAAGYESLHQWDQAIAAARRAIALKPDFQLAKNNLAWSLQQKSSTGGKP
jgi:tetratricopeptide (TPR) repeat protein